MLLNSRPASPLPDNHAERLEEFIQKLTSEREAVGSELDVLRSIYGERNIRVWTNSTTSEDDGADTIIRYEIDTNLPSHENIHIQILVSLPPTYPESFPPQLQLLSRYVGAFKVDSGLFGDILKTYISSKSSTEFIPDTVAVFDGLQHVIERCNVWYEERMSEEVAGELTREEERSQRLLNSTEKRDFILPVTMKQETTLASIPEGIELVEAEPIIDRKSIFIGRACKISHPSQVQDILLYLLSDRRIARAAHPTINAWRCTVNGVIHQEDLCQKKLKKSCEDNDDDGETAAGGRLAHLLQILVCEPAILPFDYFFSTKMLRI
ncbi:hypothetical protein Clacol_001430 [Clathrus columnatus]|uniref:RWD domain-containing protein n=1 Tax=Clathrus columnatus TaxID=1419009 RepID=A0AAV4ZZ86_9AGAM|nr:hypothetical protein Clacol_001430 [Clathrus columnatus]